jgi:hypothetical protein
VKKAGSQVTKTANVMPSRAGLGVPTIQPRFSHMPPYPTPRASRPKAEPLQSLSGERHLQSSRLAVQAKRTTTISQCFPYELYSVGSYSIRTNLEALYRQACEDCRVPPDIPVRRNIYEIRRAPPIQDWRSSALNQRSRNNTPSEGLAHDIQGVFSGVDLRGCDGHTSESIPVVATSAASFETGASE